MTPSPETAPSPGPVTEYAPAKVNLALHVTGRRGDGYHLLDSLVVFADVGDRITMSAGEGFRITGPFAPDLGAGGNLCQSAADLVGARVAMVLDKHLPVASGIGGGSSDAAAVLRGLARMGHPLPERAERLGADVPVCLHAPAPMRMRGLGEDLSPVPPVPPMWMVLVNPGEALSTPAVFAALDRRDNPPLPAPEWDDAEGFWRWLAQTRNDLFPAARRIAPVIDTVLTAIEETGPRAARMSGSGATCFGLYDTAAQAKSAAERIARPGWWVVHAPVLGTRNQGETG